MAVHHLHPEEVHVGPYEQDIPAVCKKLRRCVTTYSWIFHRNVAEVVVTANLRAQRGWLWQVWATRIGVILYNQDKRDPRVTFWHPDQVQPVREAKGWPAPAGYKRPALSETHGLFDQEGF